VPWGGEPGLGAGDEPSSSLLLPSPGAGAALQPVPSWRHGVQEQPPPWATETGRVAGSAPATEAGEGVGDVVAGGGAGRDRGVGVEDEDDEAAGGGVDDEVVDVEAADGVVGVVAADEVASSMLETAEGAGSRCLFAACTSSRSCMRTTP
jgi:hypothetical protein